jgi:hypothetical protein
MKDIIGNSKNGNNDNNRNKKNFPLIRRSIFIISLVFCEGERTDIGRINYDQIRRERASDFLRADKNSELERRLTANEESRPG